MRLSRSSGLIGALLILLLVVVGFVLFRDANRTQPDNRVVEVDWRATATYARKEAEFDLLAPRRLPEGWRATSARFGAGDARMWHLGLLTDEGRYVGLEQAPDSPDTMVEQHVDGANLSGRLAGHGVLSCPDGTSMGRVARNFRLILAARRPLAQSR